VNEKLFRVVAAWCARNYPGQSPRQIAIQFERRGPAAKLPIPPGFSTLEPRTKKSRGDGPRRHDPKARQRSYREPEPRRKRPEPERRQKRSEKPAVKPAPSENRHSDDFRCVVWDGVEYSFSTLQAEAVKRLWQYWEQGTPDYHQTRLLDDIGSSRDPDRGDARLRDIFRTSGGGTHPAFPTRERRDTMIRPGSTKGTWRLVSVHWKKPGVPA
jgi:hypothetical protein